MPNQPKKIVVLNDDINYVVVDRNDMTWLSFYLETRFGLKYVQINNESDYDNTSSYEIIDESKFSSFILKYSEYIIKIFGD